MFHAQVKDLMELKAQYRATTGHEYKPPATTDEAKPKKESQPAKELAPGEISKSEQKRREKEVLPVVRVRVTCCAILCTVAGAEAGGSGREGEGEGRQGRHGRCGTCLYRAIIDALSIRGWHGRRINTVLSGGAKAKATEDDEELDPTQALTMKPRPFAAYSG